MPGSGCSRSSRCWRHASTAVSGSGSGPAPGTTSSGRPSPIPSPRTTCHLERAGFRRVPAACRRRKTSAGPPRRHRLRRLPRCVNGQCRAEWRVPNAPPHHLWSVLGPGQTGYAAEHRAFLNRADRPGKLTRPTDRPCRARPLRHILANGATDAEQKLGGA